MKKYILERVLLNKKTIIIIIANKLQELCKLTSNAIAKKIIIRRIPEYVEINMSQ